MGDRPDLRQNLRGNLGRELLLALQGTSLGISWAPGQREPIMS
jgi:hypothetical protein